MTKVKKIWATGFSKSVIWIMLFSVDCRSQEVIGDSGDATYRIVPIYRIWQLYTSSYDSSGIMRFIMTVHLSSRSSRIENPMARDESQS